MKILVPVKPVADPNTKASTWLAAQNGRTEGVTFVINYFDLIALEEALRIREKVQGEVVLVSICKPEMLTQVRSAIAMGANRCTVLEPDGPKSWFQVAAALKKVVEKEQPNLVLMGKQATDDDASQVGPILAEMLDWPQATYVSKITLAADQTKATVAREVDEGIEVLEVDLPAVITTDLRLNEPRYATLPNLIKAKKVPIDQRVWADWGIAAETLVRVEGHELAGGRGGGVKMVPDATALVALLREQKVVG
ncbi:MAG: electron transfer flavoprotein subunit beta/FixA family protein [Planctomycetota bacterium]